MVSHTKLIILIFVTVLRCLSKEKEEVLLEGMPSHYYDDVCIPSVFHLYLSIYKCETSLTQGS
jgi:hypothetical protein